MQIFEPWKLSKADLESACVVIGSSGYPNLIAFLAAVDGGDVPIGASPQGLRGDTYPKGKGSGGEKYRERWAPHGSHSAQHSPEPNAVKSDFIQSSASE